ncbi:hypothetical protein MTO96_044638, partial [Rhipicephalus appendiculatus]
MKLTRLTDDAVPTIFPDSPDYLSDTHQSREEPEIKKKRRQDEQLQKAIEESVLAHKKELDENKLTCLDDIKSRLHLLQAKYWSVVNADGHVIFAHIEATMEEAPKLISSVVISSDMCVCVFVGGARLTSDERLAVPEVVHDMRVLTQLLDNVQEYCGRRERGQDEKVNGVLKLVASLLKDISREDLLEDERVEAIMFLREQCQLLLRRTKREDGSPWEPTKNSRICSQHFINGEKSNDPRSPAYVPTIFPSVYGRTKHGTSKRYQRLRARKQKVDSITDAQALEDVMVDCTSEEEKISAAVKETVASSKRLARVAMACMSVEMSVVPTGEGLRLASGDDTDVASVVVPEVKSMGACTASLGGEVACEAKSVESPTGAAMTAADSALAAVSVVA